MLLLLLAPTHAVVATGTYANPVIAADFPDPAVLRLDDGSFVAFATGSGSRHIQCASSTDLVTWTVQPDALPTLPVWACQNCHRSCAPDVQRHGGTYFMYFLAYTASEPRRNCIGVAMSTSALGPYVGEASPTVCDGDGAAAMDPRSYDHEDGSVWLYYGSHKYPIMVVQLAPDRLRVAPEAKPVAAIHPDSSSYGREIEGPWVYRDATGALTMLYSGSQCCGHGAHYAVMAARSASGHPVGPWAKLGGPSGDGSVVLASDPAWAWVTAPGHNAVVRDDAGVDWLLYHANAGGQCNASYCARFLYLDRLHYNRTFNGTAAWPWTEGPSHSLQSAPTIRSSPRADSDIHT